MHEHLLRGKAALGQLLKQLTHQRLGPVGDRLSEGLVAHAHDAQLELVRVRVRVRVRITVTLSLSLSLTLSLSLSLTCSIVLPRKAGLPG